MRALWLGLGIGLALARPPFALLRVVARLLPEVVFFADTSERAIALTLDDGPHPSTTPAVLDALRAHGARATFFLIGELVREHPALVQRIAAEGHELGNHGLREQSSAALPQAALDDSLGETHQELARFGPVKLFRPGSGWVTRRILEASARHGYRCVLGSVYSHDAQLRWPRYVVFDVVSRVRPGAIVILHEGRPERADVGELLQDILPTLRARGFEITTVSDLLRRPSGTP
jgi:peptidoglycan/xylan/chitin deacetylase (PgdA/CDA1 family)